VFLPSRVMMHHNMAAISSCYQGYYILDMLITLTKLRMPVHCEGRLRIFARMFMSSF